MDKINENWQRYLLTEIKARAATRQLTRIYMLMLRTFITQEDQQGLTYDKEEFPAYREKWRTEGKVVLITAGKYGDILSEGLDTVPTLLDQWLKDGLPKSLLNNLRLRLSLSPGVDRSISGPAAGSVFSLIGGGAEKTGISIRIAYDKELFSKNAEQDLGKLLSTLDGVLYHEFVHYLQENDLIKSSGQQKSDIPDGPAIIKQFQKQIEAGIKQDTTPFVEYMLQPAEIEGHARGYYLDSRNLGVPWEQLIDQFFEDVVTFTQSTGKWMEVPSTPQQIDDMRNQLDTRVKPELIKYAQKNLPCAMMNNGKPVSPRCNKPSKIRKISNQALKKMKTIWGGAQGLAAMAKKKSPFGKYL